MHAANFFHGQSSSCKFHRSKGGHFLDVTYIEKNSGRKKERKEEGKNRNRMAHQRPLIARNKILRI